ncbi:MAG: DNA-protecting protein DprA [Gammaproteobacteria bacterium]|nr:DNA-processing protein DprA [Gammaproteobacteria bacterium]MCP5136710.1 DNA-protecting protein DprA [Gammaproteobacteria bacterium]
MDAQTLKDWLALWRVPGVGARGFSALVERFGSPAAVLAASRSALSGAGLRERSLDGIAHPDWAGVEADLNWAAQPGCHIVCRADTDYPNLLTDLGDPPPLLFVRGRPEVLGLPQLAIVGSRKPTKSGAETARDFAKSLAGSGLAITSGLALGIDAASHQGALDAGGITIAVMGTGPDRLYPVRNQDLAEAIAEQGALITEYPVGTPVLANNFPRRNRVISGMAVGTLVVEAALRSGSLITARLAMEQGREVFAIPGSIHNPMARGCNALIKQGAKLVETAQDIGDELGALIGLFDTGDGPRIEDAESIDAGFDAGLDADYQRLIDVIGFEPTSVDSIVERSQLTPEVVSSMLLLLELQGRVEAIPGGRFSRTR